MLLGFKKELKLNNLQLTQVAKRASTARHAYNWELSLTKQILDPDRQHPEDKIKFSCARWIFLSIATGTRVLI